MEHFDKYNHFSPLQRTIIAKNYFFFSVVPTISIFGEGSKLQSVETISNNNNVAMVIIPGKNRAVDALKTCKENQQSEGM